MKELVVFGSARVDAFLELHDELTGEFCRLDTKECFIELSYASKLPLKRVTFCVGGNGANVAVGVKRLGVDATLVAELGCGHIAEFAKKELGKEIPLDFVTQTQNIEQGFGAVIVYHGERTILSYYSPGRPPFPDNLDSSNWAYLTSIGENFEGFFEDVFTWINKNKTKLIFNPGGRQIAKGKDWLSKYLQKTYLILVNRQEAEKIVEKTNSLGRERELLDKVCELGPKVVVITDGPNGAFAKEGDKYFYVGVLPVDAYERTGAGDAFSSGVISAIIKGRDIKEALLWGSANSSSVIGYIGPQRGLLREDEIGEWLQRSQSSGLIVKEI